MWGLGKCVCSLKIKLRVYSCELDGFWVLLLYGLITNWKQARLTWPRPIPNSEHVYASLTDTCGPRQSSDRLNTSEIKNEEHKSFTRTWKVVVFWVRRRTRTDQRKVSHRNRTQETSVMQVTCSRCFCVRACRQVCGGGVAYKLPAAGKVRVTCSAPVPAPLWKNSVCWWVCSLIAQPVRSPESQSGDHPPAGESVITHTCGLCTASPHSRSCCCFFLFCCLLAGCLFLAVCRVRADFSNHFQRNSIDARVVFRKHAVLMRDCDV